MSKPLQLRVPNDLDELVNSWMDKNPDINKSQLYFAAVRKYITEPQVLEPVSIVDDDEALRMADGVLTQHKHTMDRLK